MEFFFAITKNDLKKKKTVAILSTALTEKKKTTTENRTENRQIDENDVFLASKNKKNCK